MTDREKNDGPGGSADTRSMDAVIVTGYKRHPPPDLDPWAVASAQAAIEAEPWQPSLGGKSCVSEKEK